jgi:exonuclease SbcC
MAQEDLEARGAEVKAQLEALQKAIEALSIRETKLQERQKSWTEYQQLLEQRQILEQRAKHVARLRELIAREEAIEPLRYLYQDLQRSRQKLQDRRRVLEEERLRLQELERRQAQALSELQEIPAMKSRLEEIALLVAGLSDIQDKQAKLKEVQQQYKELQEEWRVKNAQRMQQEEQLIALEAKRQAIRERRETLEGEELKAEGLEEELLSLERIRDRAEQDQAQRQELASLLAQQGKAVGPEDLRRALSHKLLEIHEEGEPCPVCGNQPWEPQAKLVGPDTVPKIDLELAAKVSLLQKNLPETPITFDQVGYQALIEAKKARHTQREELKSLAIELEELDQKYEVIRDRLSTLDVQMAEIRSRGEGAKERIDDLEAGDWPRVDPAILKGEEQQLKDQVSSREKDGQEAQQQLEKQRVLLEERTQQLTAEASEVNDRDVKIRQELKKAGLEVPEVLDSLFGEVFQKERAKSEVEKFNRDQQQLENRMGNLGRDGSQVTEDPLTELREVQSELARAKDQREGVQEGWVRLEAALQGLKDRLEQRAALFEQRAELIQQQETWEKLALTLSGQKGKKVRFSAFVLQFFLQDILLLANARLKGLSRGQYQFRLKTNNQDRRKKGGLDLVIFDSYCGEERRPQTLSGGEKFLASLALALGLSDGFTLRQGGRNLDALFIDEGFGTLDEEALDRALTVLDEIRSGRVIGLISHVRGLQERIPRWSRSLKPQKGADYSFPADSFSRSIYRKGVVLTRKAPRVRGVPRDPRRGKMPFLEKSQSPAETNKKIAQISPLGQSRILLQTSDWGWNQ